MTTTDPDGAADTLHCYRHPSRETLVRCSHCERPICTSCMVAAPVGMRCPDCARGSGPGDPRGARAPRRAPVLRFGALGGGTTVTIALIVVNVVVFLAELAQGVTLTGTGGSIVGDGGVRALEVADGDWYRLVTYGFLHAGMLHLLFNMWALWILGGPLEEYVGSARMAVIYAASVIWGAVGALLLSPDSLTVGASGGVFGLMGALLVLSRHRGMEMIGSSVGVLLLVNLVITFAIPGISIGGHLGGLVGGAASAFVLSGFGRGHMAYGRMTPLLVSLSAAVLVGGLVAGVVAAGAA